MSGVQSLLMSQATVWIFASWLPFSIRYGSCFCVLLCHNFKLPQSIYWLSKCLLDKQTSQNDSVQIVYPITSRQWHIASSNSVFIGQSICYWVEQLGYSFWWHHINFFVMFYLPGAWILCFYLKCKHMYRASDSLSSDVLLMSHCHHGWGYWEPDPQHQHHQDSAMLFHVFLCILILWSSFL